MRREDHPFWEVYNHWRTAKLNIRYYSHYEYAHNAWNIIFEIAIAITTPTGAIAALWFWNTDWGAVLWKVLLVIASICSVLKPILKLQSKCAYFHQILTEYRLLHHDLDQLIYNVKCEKQFDKSFKDSFEKINQRERKLIADSQTVDNQRAVDKFQDEINAQLADYEFFIPEE